MNTVTAFLPLYESGHVVAEMTVTIRAAYDGAFGNPYAASEVSFEDVSGKRHAFSDQRAAEVLAQIRRDQPEVWREIEEVAEADHLEGCDEAA